MASDELPTLPDSFTYEWILDNDCTPYVAGNAALSNTVVPESFVEAVRLCFEPVTQRHPPPRNG